MPDRELSDLDRFGEFAPLDTPMPITRGDVLDLLVSADDGDGGRIAVSVRAACLWAERQVERRGTTCDVIMFAGALAGMVTSIEVLAGAWLAGGDLIAALDAPGVRVWIRALTAGQYEHGRA